MRKSVILIFLSLLYLSLLTPFLYSFGFCYPRGDDYDGITRAMFLFDLPGAFYEVIREWLTWSGRYTYHFLAVFLGKAAESSIYYGIVCALIFLTFGIGFFKLARIALLGVIESIFFSLAALCVLMACHSQAQDFYLLTDALTIVLQAACYFIFLSQLFALWRSSNIQAEYHARKYCIFWGIVTIGIYEHAALAVFWTISAAILYSCMPQVKKLLPDKGKNLLNSLRSCFIWIFCALMFSFLAPGNMVRKNVRNVNVEQVWTQVSNIPVEWANFLKDFFSSPWPLATLCLALLIILLSSQKNRVFFPGKILALISLFVFFLFSLSVTTLHALSDVSLLSESKLCASLEIYGAASLGFFFYSIVCQKLSIFYLKKIFLSLSCLILILIYILSDNFLICAQNAANGQMLLYADFMKVRQRWLAQMAIKTTIKQDKFGLIGEVENPNSRRRKAYPEKGAAIVQSFPRSIFPVKTKLGLSAVPEGWPNLWAAWVYGLCSLAELPPDPQRAINIVKSGRGKILDLPLSLFDTGITKAWLALDSQNPNPTFQGAWLVLSGQKPIKLKVLLPSAISNLRLIPLALQKRDRQVLDYIEEFRADVFTHFFTIPLEAELKGNGEITTLWLAPLYFMEHIPQYLFASVDDLVYHKLQVYNSFK